jgi:ribosome-associated protein
MPKGKKTLSSSEQLIDSIVNGIQEVKGRQTVVLDLRKVENSSTDFFVICHGTSTTQAEAIARSVEKFTEEERKESPWHIEGLQTAQWILLDYVDVVVHVFEETQRSVYDLEGLWADGEILSVEARA